ncbi:Glucose-6-phosphate isomerase [hydrothermal vent metagenome]|uniref:glucose-6-phosphate isomerase n=1 Tax=hydrothermal vent metagenome TaxID=652676 RepID=A0A3B1C0W8_9ZZZZ
MTHDISLDYTNVMVDAVGDDNGISDEHLKALKQRAGKIHTDLAKKRKSGALPFFELPYNIAEAKKLKNAGRALGKKFSTMVVLGIGGSALGTTALLTALCHSAHNSLTPKKRGGMRVFIEDNIDPDHFAELLSTLKLKETVFNVISKSGSTAETMAQFMIVSDLLKRKLGKEWRKHIILTTDAKAGALRTIADENKIKSFIVPDRVGGRFTVFTPVSLLPAAAAGIDIVKLLKGAARMDERTSQKPLLQNPAYLFASINYLLDTAKAKRMTVMMPYSNRLKDMADWFRQMWAESLGKRRDIDGNQIYAGQTPIKALGATDQHSQIQLYVEGPFDKVLCFLEVSKHDNEVLIPEGFEKLPGVSYLGGHSMNELFAVEKKGTEYALTQNNRPNMTINFPEVSAHTVGQLLYMLEVATAFAGGLYRVDAFDQPGVEFGKEYAYAMLGRAGFEKKRAELTASENVKKRVL